jgi:rare lipoprotein A
MLMSLPRFAVASITLTVAVAVIPVHNAKGQAGGDLAAVRRQLAAANQESTQVLNELKALDARLFQVGRSIARDEREVGRLQGGVRATEAHITQLEGQMQALKRSTNARARRIYKNGPAAILATLFSAQTFDDMPRLRIFWEIVSEKDNKTILDSSRLRDDLAGERVRLAGQAKNLAARTAGLEKLRDGLREDREKRGAKLVQLRTAIEKAVAAEKAILAARAAAVKVPTGSCSPGGARQEAADRRLATLLDWYAPAAGSEPFMPRKLGSTGIVTTGSASWYGPGFDGCRSSSGATFRANQMTAASLSLPLGTLLKVTRGGRAVVVVITDKGPYVAGRVLDLSKAAAQAIGMSGTGDVNMEILLPKEPAPSFP